MDITVYKLLHLIGFLLVFQALGAAIALAGKDRSAPWRRASVIGHGLGLLFILVAGFGMMARLELFGMPPGWIWVKLLVWVAIGALPFVLRRQPTMAHAAWGAAIALGTLAAIMGIFKPF